MASVLSFQQNQPAHTVSDGSGDGQLLNALAKYVTTGSGARHTTQAELQELVSTVAARPGGRAHLESLVQHEEYPERTIWQNRATAIGSISLSKTGLTLSIKIPSLDVSFSGDGVGFFRPFEGPLHNGTVWYNGPDNLQPGPADFKLHVDNVRELLFQYYLQKDVANTLQLTLHIDIYRNQVYVASFNFGPIAFVLAPGIQEGSGNFA
ncbi:hypothetical protein ACJ41O_006038 [Fusarium nematophilum]